MRNKRAGRGADVEEEGREKVVRNNIQTKQMMSGEEDTYMYIRTRPALE